MVCSFALRNAPPVPAWRRVAVAYNRTGRGRGHRPQAAGWLRRTTMLFRQLFDQTSGTYSYLLASRRGGEALIIDPVLEKVDRYLQLVRELDLKLVKAVDTHMHADHITGLGALRDRTHCCMSSEHFGHLAWQLKRMS